MQCISKYHSCIITTPLFSNIFCFYNILYCIKSLQEIQDFCTLYIHTFRLHALWILNHNVAWWGTKSVSYISIQVWNWTLYIKQTHNSSASVIDEQFMETWALSWSPEYFWSCSFFKHSNIGVQEVSSYLTNDPKYIVAQWHRTCSVGCQRSLLTESRKVIRQAGASSRLWVTYQILFKNDLWY